MLYFLNKGLILWLSATIHYCRSRSTKFRCNNKLCCNYSM